MADIKVWSDPSLLSKDRLQKELSFFNVAFSSSSTKKVWCVCARLLACKKQMNILLHSDP